MVDLSTTVAAKSDQLNADDLVGGPITIRITKVAATGNAEQPISIFYDGDNGKPYKPGKSMRRVLIAFWDKEGNDYVGRWLTLFRDPEVKFGGMKVGGIRISHMSHIDRQGVTAIQVKKGAKAEYRVEPLRVPGDKPRMTVEQQAEAYEKALGDFAEWSDLIAYRDLPARAAWREGLKETHPGLYQRVTEAFDKRLSELRPAVEEEDEAEDQSISPSADTGALFEDDE